MKNNQNQESPDYYEDGSLEIVDIFQSIQGEGPRVGSTAVFIRLAGCNLQCSWCDTDYTTNRRRMSVKDITQQIIENYPGTRLIVLTGGEPFRQRLHPLIHSLRLRFGNPFLPFQIETNGTLAPCGLRSREWEEREFRNVEIVCSPKTTDSQIHPLISKYAVAVKYVLDYKTVDSIDGLPIGLARNFWSRPEIFVQPMDNEDKEKNTQCCIDSCLKYGYRLSLQIHKLLGLK